MAHRSFLDNISAVKNFLRLDTYTLVVAEIVVLGGDAEASFGPPGALPGGELHSIYPLPDINFPVVIIQTLGSWSSFSFSGLRGEEDSGDGALESIIEEMGVRIYKLIFQVDEVVANDSEITSKEKEAGMRTEFLSFMIQHH